MKTHYVGPVYVHYHEAHFTVLGGELSTDAYRDQSNGLCGAAAPNQLTLRFGVHTGCVNISVLLSEVEPPPNMFWEEMVEAPLTVDRRVHLSLMDFNGDPWGDEVFFEPGSYRVRFSAINFEQVEVSTTETDSTQCYELIIWAAPLHADIVLRTKSSLAQHYHSNHGRST